MERSVAAGLIPLTLAPFAGGSVSPYTDAALCALLLIHSHMGFQQIIVDYIPTKDHPTARKLFGWGLMAGTAVVGIGLYEFETTDIGITETVKRIWRA
jgi:succinate dehydrogenase (ubiquinone) membrane anchor subunit